MLELNNVYKTFNLGTINEKKALNGVNLKLEDGDFVTVIGGNGAGKSTTLNAVAGVWPIDSGSIIIDGVDMTGLSEHKRAPYLGRVFQDPMNGTAATMEIIENLALAARRGQHRGLKWGVTKSEKKKYREMLAKLDLGLEDRMTSKVGLLSGGQRQALTLLMATIKKPKLLLLDEPFAALDSYLKWKMEQQMMDLLKDIQKPALFVSHSRDEVYRLCDTVSCINQGKMEVIEPVKEFFKNPKTKTAALLSGCKNICSVELVKDLEPTETQMKDTSSGKLWAAEWGVAFNVSKEAFAARTVGIRAHYMMQK